MPNAFDVLDSCSTKLAEAQRMVSKTRKVAAVVSGVAVAGGFALLVWKVLGPDPVDVPPSPEVD